jgi:hypothetical protein
MTAGRTLFGYAGMRPATGSDRAFLYAAAVFNFVAVALVVLLTRVEPAWLGLDPPSASQQFYADLSALLIGGFGCAYALGARDLPRFWPFIAMGAACKAGVAALALAYYLAGHVGALVLGLASCDAVFAVLFARLLRRHAAG